MDDDRISLKLDRLSAQQERSAIILEDVHNSLTAMLAAMEGISAIQETQGEMLLKLTEAVGHEDSDASEIVKLLRKLNTLVAGLDRTVLGLPRLVMDAVALERDGELPDEPEPAAPHPGN